VRGGEGEPDRPDPVIRGKWGVGGGVAGLQKNYLRPFGPHFGLKIRGPRVPPKDQLLEMNTSPHGR